MTKLTALAEKFAHANLFTPVIIKAKRNKSRNVYSAIANIVNNIGFVKNLQERNRDLINMFPTRRIKRWEMVSTLLPREGVFALPESSEVEKIYLDQRMTAFQFSTIDDSGLFELKQGRIKFTSTDQTRKLMGADIANSIVELFSNQ